MEIQAGHERSTAQVESASALIMAATKSSGEIVEVPLPPSESTLVTVLVPPDWVSEPVPDVPTYSADADSDLPVMPDGALFTLTAPLPKLTLPVPETATPPLRLIEPFATAESVP